MIRKILTMCVLLLLVAGVQASNVNGHFFKSLKKQVVMVSDVENYFSQWFSLPAETEWREVSHKTDKLGMERIEFRQYVAGVEVEHSQILIHAKNGRVQTANGTVMEKKQTPAKLRKAQLVYKNGTPTDLLGRTLYLVDTPSGYRYAVKVLSADKKEWIYTDVDTEEVLKRIPTQYHLSADPVKVTGTSIYSGQVEMDASHDSESGAYILWDQQRNIHTMIGATMPSLEQMQASHTLTQNFPELASTLPVPEEQMTPEMWNDWNQNAGISPTSLNYINYIARNAIYAHSTEPNFSSYNFNTITIDKLGYYDEENDLIEIVPSKFNPLSLYIRIQYKDTYGMIEKALNVVEKFPCTIDLKQYFDEIPTAGVDIHLFAVTIDNNNAQNATWLSSITLVPNESGHKEWETENVKAKVTYEKGSWSANDIHWGMQHTYDFFLNNFGRNSYDDKGSPIYNLFYMPDRSYQNSTFVLNFPTNNAAAANAGSSQMLYGMGSRDGGMGSMYPVVELSIMAHEFTHMVTYATANLVYQGESGALNESFSDLMGISVKKYVQGNDAPWTIGEGVMEYFSNMRSMSFPKTGMDNNDPSPDTYQGEYWVDTESQADHGGVHHNSGVQNKWYYLLTDGDSGTNDKGYSYQVEGIGLEKSQQIAYRTLTEYATQQSQYADIRLASLQAAEDLYGENSVEVQTVAAAWDAVGVYKDGETTALTLVNSEERIVNSGVYDLQGRKVAQPTKGLYIVNGKKVVMK